MRFIPTSVDQLFLIELDLRLDSRGFFARAWCSQELRELGINGECAQANLSYNTHHGTLRGMHFQLAPHAEAKLVRVVRGAVHDVGLDLRPQSPTYGKWFATELSAENRRAVFIPEGCAHGYLTLTPDAEVLYLVSTPYHPASARGILWNAAMLQGAWPFEPRVISDQDRQWPATLDMAESLTAPVVHGPHSISRRPAGKGEGSHMRDPVQRRHRPGTLHSPSFQFVPDLRSQLILF